MKWGLLFIVVVLLVGISYGSEGVSIDQEIYSEFVDKEYVSVIIALVEEDIEHEGIEISSETKKLIEDRELEVLRSLSESEFKFKRKLGSSPVLIGEISKDGLEKLENDERVKGVYKNGIITIDLTTSTNQINATLLHSRVIGSNKVNGSGETICIIDSGIDYTQSAFGLCTNDTFLNGSCLKVIGGVDYCADDNSCSTEDLDPMDAHGHGTHVAGIAASFDENFTGVAPGASLVAIKVFNASGSAPAASLLTAIDWCRTNASAYNISVISMSLSVSGSESSSACDANTFASSANDAANAGILTIASSGNSGLTTKIAAPACGSNVTSVGSVEDDDTKSSFSNVASILDLFAPGRTIKSIKSGTTSSAFNSVCTLDGIYATCSGTSQAAPHVAGAGALLLQYKKLENGTNLTPTELRNAFVNNGKNISTDGLVIPRIDVWNALLSVDSLTPSSSLSVSTNQLDITSGNVSINFTGVDTNLLTAYVNVSFNGSVLFQLTGNNTLTSSNLSNVGSHNITLFVADEAGNENTTYSELVVFNNSAPVTSLNNPVDGLKTGADNVVLNCSAIDDDVLQNITSYHNVSQSYGSSVTRNVTGNATVNFSLTSIPDGGYIWNCLSYDNNSNSDFGDYNYSFSVDTTSPSITLISPDDGATVTTSSPTFTYQVTDVNAVSNCSLLISDTVRTTDTSISKGTDQDISASSLSNGNYTWKIRCIDELANTQTSSGRDFTVSVSSDSDDDSGGGGGGGGGSGSGDDDDEEDEVEEYDGDLGELGKSEVRETLPLGKEITFTLNEEEYSISIKNKGENFVTLDVDGEEIILKLGKGKEIDLDGDNIVDIMLTLSSLSSGSVDLKLKRLSGLEDLTGDVVGDDGFKINLFEDLDSSISSLAIVLIAILTIGILDYYVFRAVLPRKGWGKPKI